MSFKNVVIASDIPANRQLIKDGENGFLFSDLTALKKIIKMICSSKNLKIEVAKKARKTIEDKFSYQEVTRIYINLYKELLGL